MVLPDNIKPVICIAGPTASGKSAWAIELAQAVDGEIINADSMQVYRELQILSARPDVKETAMVPHHLFGHVSASHNYSTGQWVRDVEPIILDCLARQKTPILVGGTGLYFKALTQGLASIPDPTPEAKATTDKLLSKSISELRTKAEVLDPIATARVLGDDPQRLSRIVSVALGTGKPLSIWQQDTRPIIPKPFWQGAVLLPDRQKLYDRIESRYEAMLENGGLDEAKSMLKFDLRRDLPAMKAIGLPPLMEFLEGNISYDEALNQAKRDTRRFAKRQFTWFRGQAKDWFSVINPQNQAQFRQNIS